MGNIFGRKKHANLEEENDEEVPAQEFLEPHLACAIYAALPAVHQRRLLTLCRAIAEKGPSPDEWTKWKIFKWAGNRWNPHAEHGQILQLSADGLTFMDSEVNRYAFVRAIQCAQFPPTHQAGCPQICYFELTVTEKDGFISFGFRPKDWPNPPILDIFVICSDAIHWVGQSVHTLAAQLPNIRISEKEIATVGCGLVKHMGKRKVFFTKNGKLFVDPIPLPPTTPADVPLFPFVNTGSGDFALPLETNFGLTPFQFKFEGNEAKLLQ